MFNRTTDSLWVKGPGIMTLLALAITPALAQSPNRNVRIEVQIQSAGFSRNGLNETLRQSEERQSLLVMDGAEGHLFIGQNVPYATWYRDYLREEGYLTGQMTFRNVGTSLLVRPRILGNQIEIHAIPEVSYDTQDGRGTIALTRLSTTVLAENGEPIQIGSVSQRSEFESRFYRRDTGEAVKIILTPVILES